MRIGKSGGRMYLYVTPRELRMRTRWRFLGLVSASASFDLPFAFCLATDLYTDAMVRLARETFW